MNRVYLGKRTPDGPTVLIEKSGEITPLLHVKKHSESLEWGYGGSAPADLARSILFDAVGEELANRHYQDFKFDVVAEFQADGWELSKRQVLDWFYKKGIEIKEH